MTDEFEVNFTPARELLFKLSRGLAVKPHVETTGLEGMVIDPLTGEQLIQKAGEVIHIENAKHVGKDTGDIGDNKQ